MTPEEIAHEAQTDAPAARRMWAAPMSAAVPATGAIGAFLEPYRVRLCPWMPRSLVCASVFREWSKRRRADGSLEPPREDVCHGAGFFEVGTRQEPAGKHGHVYGPDGSILTGKASIGGGDARCEHKLPGLDWQGTPIGRAALATGYDVATIENHALAVWLDPRVQALAFLDYDTARVSAGVVKAFPSLFEAVGTPWHLECLAFDFSRGEGALTTVLRDQAPALRKLTPLTLAAGSRWSFFASAVNSRFPQWAKGVMNTGRKLALASVLADLDAGGAT